MSEAAVKLNIKVVPGATQSEVVGWLGSELKIRTSAPPKKGQANRDVIRLLAARLNVPARDIAITRGDTSTRKALTINGLTRQELEDRLR